MPRYLRNLNATDCVPVAVINAMKWQGRKAGRKDEAFLKEFLRWNVRGGGVYDVHLYAALKLLGASQDDHTKSRVNELLREGYLVLVQVFWKHIHAKHVFLLTAYEKRLWRVVGLTGDGPTWVRPSGLWRFLSRQRALRIYRIGR